MSLINEALKKAQKQRAHEPHAATPVGAPVPPPAPVGRVAKRAQPMPAQTLVLIGLLCVVLVVAVVAGGWFVFSQTSSTPPAVATPAPAKPAVSTAATGGSAPAVSPAPAEGAPAVATPVPAVSTPAVAAVPTPAAVTPSPAAPPVNAPAAGTTATTSLLAPNPVAGATTPATEDPYRIDLATAIRMAVPPNPKVSAVVDTLRVSGIRAAANDPKVLMNDRVYRLNDLVDRTTGLRLLEINPTHLVFIDEAGATYTKNF